MSEESRVDCAADELGGAEEPNDTEPQAEAALEDKSEAGVAVDPETDGQQQDADTVVDENAPESQHDTDVNTSAVVADFEASDDEDENPDETVNVIIKPSSKGGIYKTGTTYQARSASHATQLLKASRQGVELDDPGDIHGVPTIEFNLSTLGEEEKPWKRPGADITDYFNYGFTEETWIQYCEKQRILRQEYANATLKPVLATGGTGLLHRLRNGSLATAAFKHHLSSVASINVVNSTGLLGDRAQPGLLLTGSDVTDRLLNAAASGGGSATTGSSGAIHFSQPPPGYLPGAGGQLPVGGSGTAGFNLQQQSAQLLAAAAGVSNLFPLPPPVLAGLASGNVGWPGVLGAAESHGTMIDPVTGQLVSAAGFIDHVNRSPESVYSNEDRHVSRRSRRHYHSPDDGPYFDRSTYRARRRSRSSSREYQHSRHRRHHDSGRGDRESEHRRSGGSSRHSRRGDRREEGQHRYTGPPEEQELVDIDLVNGDPNGQSRRSDRFVRSDSRRPRRHRSRSRSGSRKRDRDRSYRLTSSVRGSSPNRAPRKLNPSSSPQPDPLSIAAAAAANINAVVLGGNSCPTVKGS